MTSPGDHFLFLYLFLGGRADQHCSSPSAGDGGLVASPEIPGDEGLSHPQIKPCVPQGQSKEKYPQGHFMCQFMLPLPSYSRPKRKAGVILTLGFSMWENESEKQQCSIYSLWQYLFPVASPSFVYPILGAELLQGAGPIWCPSPALGSDCFPPTEALQELWELGASKGSPCPQEGQGGAGLAVRDW